MRFCDNQKMLLHRRDSKVEHVQKVLLFHIDFNNKGPAIFNDTITVRGF